MAPWTPSVADSYGALAPQAHLDVLRPLVREAFGPRIGGAALDFGCGPGHLAATLLELGAEPALGVDESLAMLALARREGPDGLRLVRGDERSLPGLGRFDAVLCSLVLMMCPTRQRLEAAAANLVGALTPRGRLLVVVTHPCFRGRRHGTFASEVPEDFTYWDSGRPFRVLLDPPESDDSARITDFHWTIEDTVGALTAAGGAVHRLWELPARPSPESPPAYLGVLVANGEVAA